MMVPFFLDLSTNASLSLVEPDGSNAIEAAVIWLNGILLGTLATSIAVVAVAWVGMMTLAGRVKLREGVAVVLGCFILFGASNIVAGIRSLTNADSGKYPAMQAIVQPAPTVLRTPEQAYDPYAGAAVPLRQ